MAPSNKQNTPRLFPQPCLHCAQKDRLPPRRGRFQPETTDPEADGMNGTHQAAGNLHAAVFRKSDRILHCRGAHSHRIQRICVAEFRTASPEFSPGQIPRSVFALSTLYYCCSQRLRSLLVLLRETLKLSFSRLANSCKAPRNISRSRPVITAVASAVSSAYG